MNGLQTCERFALVESDGKGLTITTFNDRIEMAMSLLYKEGARMNDGEGPRTRQEAYAFWGDVQLRLPKTMNQFMKDWFEEPLVDEEEEDDE
jgi:hypothetical protein